MDLEMLDKLKTLEKSILALLALVLLSSIGNGIINVLIQPYLKHIGFDPREVGLLQFISSVATSLSLVPAAYTSDRYGRKKIAIGSLIFSIPGFILILLPAERVVLYVGFALLGVGNAMTAVTLNPLLADVTPREKLDLVASASQIIGLVGSLLGMALTWLPQLANISLGEIAVAYRMLMALGGAVSVSGFTFLLLVRDPNGAPRGFKLGFSRETLLLTSLSALTALGAGASIWMINYYFMSKFLVEAGELGTRMMAETLLMIPSTSLAPLVSEKLGTLRAVVLLQSASIPFIIATAFSPDYLVAATVFTLRSVLMNAANPLMWSLTMRIIGEEERSRYTMLNMLGWQLAGGVGAAIGGWLMSINLDYPLFFTSLIYLTQTILLYLILHRKTQV
ncbi:MFS transporter [Infirmifilum uzonense]|uniref:MFS transporter n=1 Tax=Infirmifilum uzonense TaxID=1550241 RepID=UPI003C76975E